MCFRWLLVWMAMVASALAQESAGAQAFEKIRSLNGNWEGSFEWSGARTDKGKMDAGYYVTGGGSAVVENLLQDGQPIMTSVYHMDNGVLRLTHYCAAQNQPRLKAKRVEANAVDFAFVDATNMKSADAPHVSGLEWRMLDADHIKLTFLFDAGGKQSRELVQLRRKQEK
jgi:hypothetical protein